jgi:hypothetical protein
MSIFTDPPRSTKYGFKLGDTHLGVWALQRFINKTFDVQLVEDGTFGWETELEVKHYQRAKAVTVDGIVGPQTQAQIVRSVIVRVPHGTTLPKGLLEGIIQAESGRLIAAVNSQVSGGVDLGLTQRRVYGPPFNTALVKSAMDPYTSVTQSVEELYQRYLTFAGRVGVGTTAWRIAALAHNWPWAADQLSRGRALSTTQRAAWVPAGTKFDDGAPVVSYRDWAEFYAMGSHAHRHPGMVTRLAFGIPTR